MSDLYLIRKVIILKKIHVTMNTFIPPFFKNSSLSLNGKTCGNESHEKETYLRFSCRFITYWSRKSQSLQMRALQKRSERNRLSLL